MIPNQPDDGACHFVMAGWGSDYFFAIRIFANGYFDLFVSELRAARPIFFQEANAQPSDAHGLWNARCESDSHVIFFSYDKTPKS